MLMQGLMFSCSFNTDVPHLVLSLQTELGPEPALYCESDFAVRVQWQLRMLKKRERGKM